MELIHNMCNPEDVDLIQSIKSSHNIKPDDFCWLHTKSGIYSVKSWYEIASLDQEESEEHQPVEPSINPLLS